MSTYPGNLDINITVIVEGNADIEAGSNDLRCHVDIADKVSLVAKDPEEMERLAEAASAAAAKMRRIRWDAKLAENKAALDRLGSHGTAVAP